MQHGNSANSLKPLQLFQKAGKIMNPLKRLLVAFQISLEDNNSVNVNFVTNTKDMKLYISSGSIFVLLLTMTQLSFNFITQRFCLSSNISWKDTLSYNMYTCKKGDTNETTSNTRNEQFKLKHRSFPSITFDRKNNSPIQARWSNNRLIIMCKRKDNTANKTLCAKWIAFCYKQLRIYFVWSRFVSIVETYKIGCLK